MTEPAAIRYNFDGYGYQYMDSGSGSDWQTRVDGQMLYTHPAKTLTDEEIIVITIRWFGSGRNDFCPEQWLDLAKAILKKASEK